MDGSAPSSSAPRPGQLKRQPSRFTRMLSSVFSRRPDDEDDDEEDDDEEDDDEEDEDEDEDDEDEDEDEEGERGGRQAEAQVAVQVAAQGDFLSQVAAARTRTSGQQCT